MSGARRAVRDAARAVLVACAAALLAAGGSANAEKADHDKPTNIVYDRATWDDLKQVYIFTGNVILTKGTIIVRCDNLEVRQDPEGYDFAVATMAGPGRQVYFKQKREGYADQYIEGVGDHIEYDEKKDEVTIFTRAVVKRLDAGVPQDEMRGDTIEYNSLTEKYHVESNGRGPQAHAILAPAKPAPGAPAAAPGTGAVPGASGSSASPEASTPAAGTPRADTPTPTAPPTTPPPTTPRPTTPPPTGTAPVGATPVTTSGTPDPASLPLQPAGAIGTKPYD